MRDGNKEATKELMATFRLVVGASLSLFVLFANLQIQGRLRLTHPEVFYGGLALAALSSLLCADVFFVVVRMLHEEDDNIINQLPVVVPGALALISFALSIVLVILGQV